MCIDIGDEFLMPLQAFFCSLCCEFSKDSISGEAHLKSREHNNKFKVLLMSCMLSQVVLLLFCLVALLFVWSSLLVVVKRLTLN